MLSSITIPQHCHLTSGGGTFLGVDLSSVACNVVSPQKIPDSTFSERTYYYVDLRVPSESAAAYGHTPHWTLFRSINGSAPQLYYVTAEPTAFSNIASSGGSNQITVMSNTSWTASANQSWCTLSATSGSNNSTVNFTVGSNSSQSGRSATITFRISTGSTATVSLSQAGHAAPSYTLDVSPTSVTIAATQTTQSITVTSNTSWTVSSNQTWCTLNPTSGSNNGTVIATLSTNSGSDSRDVTITFSATGAGSKTATITQQASGSQTNYLNVSPTSLTNIPAYQNTQTITVSSNVSWSVISSATVVCTVSPSSGSGNGTVTVNVFVNTTENTRNATIIFSSPDIENPPTISVQQNASEYGQHYVTLTPATVTHDYTAAMGTDFIELQYSSTDSWSLSSDKEWCTIGTPQAGGAGSNSVWVFLTENTGDERTANIRIWSDYDSATTVITQQAYGEQSYMSAEPTSISLNSNSQNTSFSIMSNVDWTVSSN